MADEKITFSRQPDIVNQKQNFYSQIFCHTLPMAKVFLVGFMQRLLIKLLLNKSFGRLLITGFLTRVPTSLAESPLLGDSESEILADIDHQILEKQGQDWS